MRQSGREHELHDEATDAEEDEVAPLRGACRKLEVHSWNEEQDRGRDEGGPGGKVVDGD